MTDVAFGLTVIPTDTPSVFTTLTEEVETWGLDYLWVCDSTLHSHDPYGYLTIAALHTCRPKLGLNCANPYTRHPASNLNAISTVDEISGGRAALSFGSGAEPLFELGYTRGKVDTVRRSVQMTKRLLVEDKVDFVGGEMQLKGATLHYRSRKDIPIYVTASGPKMLEMAGEVADGVIFLSGGYPPCVRFAVDHIDAGAKRAGRSLKDIDLAWCGVGAIDDDRHVAIEQSRTLAAWVVKYAPHYAEIAGVPKDIMEAVRSKYQAGHFHEAEAAAALLPAEYVERLTLTGTPNDFRRRITDVVDLGVKHVEYEIMGTDRLAAARLYGRQVVPYFR
jgi:5,10-methylenetetrahydromethanopterin reductase